MPFPRNRRDGPPARACSYDFLTGPEWPAWLAGYILPVPKKAHRVPTVEAVTGPGEPPDGQHRARQIRRA
jgi:hypothetical protein